MSRRHQPPKNPVLIGIGCVFLAVMAYAVSTGLPPMMFGGDCATGQTGTGPQMAECTAAQSRGATWMAIGTVALFPAAFLSRSFTFLPAMAAMLVLTGFAALRELDEQRADISARHEQVVEVVSTCLLGAGAVLAVCAVIALVRAVRSTSAPSTT